MENIDNVSNADISEQKSSYDGKSVLLKIKAGNKVFGVVLETFKKNNPLISTAFIDTEKNIDNWIKNEGVSSGTKTSFLNITLNNIIKDVQPNFKTKVIGKTYYQSANNKTINSMKFVDLTSDFEKTPTIDEVKAYINEIVENGTKFATLSPEWFVDIKGGAKKKDHIIKSSNFKNMNKAERKRHNKYIMSLEKLLANAEYAGEKENTKKDKKPNIEKYHYFKTNVKIGDKTYQILFDTEEYKDEKSSSSANVLRSVKNLNEDTSSINDNTENINPKTVHLYNITEYKPLNQEEQQSLFEGNNKARDIRNYNIF